MGLYRAGSEKEFVMQVPASQQANRTRITAALLSILLIVGWTVVNSPFAAMALPAGVANSPSGEPTFSPSGEPTDLTVDLVSSLNPSAYGWPVTFTAMVSGAAAAGANPDGLQGGYVAQEQMQGPAGPVTFFDGDNVLGTGSVNNGVATLTTSELSPGMHTITALYDDFMSNSVNQLVVVAVTATPYTVAEGGSLTLDATGSTPDATYEWDLNGDGIFSDAFGLTPTLSWAELTALGIDDGPATHEVWLKVTVDGQAAEGQAAMASAELQITNQAPVAWVAGETTGTVGVPLTLKVGADDPGGLDAAGLFEYTVDWGDGSPVETVVGPADPPVTHTYGAAGTYTAVFTAKDRDGATSEPVYVTLIIGAPKTSTLPATGASGGGERALLAVSLIGLGAALVYYRRRVNA
jgi:hypothetical protein